MSMYEKKRAAQSPTSDKPPLIQDVLHKIITDSKKSNVIPPNPYDAAHWWIDHQEPPQRFRDDPEPIYKDSDITGWVTPYHDRLSYTLRKFLSFSEPQQVYVITNIEAGIPWRGDEIAPYSVVVEEHGKMDRNKNEYVEDALKRMKKLKFN